MKVPAAVRKIQVWIIGAAKARFAARESEAPTAAANPLEKAKASAIRSAKGIVAGEPESGSRDSVIAGVGRWDRDMGQLVSRDYGRAAAGQRRSKSYEAVARTPR